MKITVFVESEPHTENLDGVLLNRPLPNRGSFMIGARIDRAVWNTMKSAGASYWGAEELEDLDMFNSVPGWRYTSEAMEVLLRHGHQLEVHDTTVSTVDEWRALWTPEAKAAYAAKKAQEAAAAADAGARAKAAAEQAQAAAGAVYAAWVAATTQGLVSTTIAPPDGGAPYATNSGWERVYHAEKTTPGAWYDTGDTWFRATLDGVDVYQRRYGNAAVYFAPQSTVDGWVLAKDTGTVAFARHVLEYHNYKVFGSDVADRLVELRGLDHYLARATSQEWLVIASNTRCRLNDIIAHYGIRATPVAMQPYDFALAKRIRTMFGFDPYDRNGPEAVGQTADGRWFATPDSLSGGNWRELTEEQRTALGLSAEPPAQPPTLPAPYPLPSVEN